MLSAARMRREGAGDGPAASDSGRGRQVALAAPPGRLGDLQRAPVLTPGKATIQPPGSLVRCTLMGSVRLPAKAPRSSASHASAWVRRCRRRTQAARSATGPGTSRARTRRPSSTTGVRPGLALAVPGAPPADGHLDLDGGLQAVEVGALEESDLDEAHGRGSIGRRTCRRLPADDPPVRRSARDRHRDRRPPGRRRGRPAALPRRAGHAREHRLRLVHQGWRQRGRRLDGSRAGGPWGAGRAASGPRRSPRRHGGGDVRGSAPMDRGRCSSATWTRSSTRAPRRRARSTSREAAPTVPA